MSLRAGLLSAYVVLLSLPVLCQSSSPAFELASVKLSQKPVGPDSNNRLTYERAGVKFRNATLRCLVAEAYGLQLNQVLGPSWLDQREYDIEAKADGPTAKEQLRLMLRTLLTERFKLVQHRETKELRAYELVIDKAGLKIQSIEDGEVPGTTAGHRFRGDFRRLADLLAVQLTIYVSDDPTRPGRASGPPPPVLDKTGLPGTYEFGLDINPEPGSDTFAVWQRFLKDKVGLRIDSRKGPVDVLVVDGAERVPIAN